MHGYLSIGIIYSEKLWELCLLSFKYFSQHARILKLGNITRIFLSFSWEIFCHMTRLNQSRESENIWCIIRADTRGREYDIYNPWKIYRWRVSLIMYIYQTRKTTYSTPTRSGHQFCDHIRDWTDFVCSWRFSPFSAPINWLVHGHMTSNNETLYRQMPWASNIAKRETVHCHTRN